MKSSTIDKSKWTETDIKRAELVGEDVVELEIASGEYIAKEIADAKANGHRDYPEFCVNLQDGVK